MDMRSEAIDEIKDAIIYDIRRSAATDIWSCIDLTYYTCYHLMKSLVFCNNKKIDLTKTSHIAVSEAYNALYSKTRKNRIGNTVGGKRTLETWKELRSESTYNCSNARFIVDDAEAKYRLEKMGVFINDHFAFLNERFKIDITSLQTSVKKLKGWNFK